MLGKHPVIAYIPVSDVSRARKFYEDVLKLEPHEPNAAGVMYECGKGTRVFLYKSAGAGTNKASTLFWQVGDLDAEMKDLRGRGVKFEDYDMPGLKTQNGVAVGEGAKSAWFKDTEGNVLAVIQALRQPT